jgi:hypothetical protein
MQSSKKWSKAYLSNVALFAPAIAFLLYARLAPGSAQVRWHIAYLLGGVLAVVHGIWLMSRETKHGIALGVDLYLMIGAALALASPAASAAWGEGGGAASLLACVLAVGIAGLLFAPRQLCGAAGVDETRARAMCATMVAVTIAALAVAVPLRHEPLLGGVLPIVGLMLARAGVERRVLATAN